MKTKKIMSVVLALALLLSLQGVGSIKAEAAKRKMKLSVGKKITLTKGKTKKVKVKNLPKKAKVTWTSSKKSVAKVGKKTGKITAKKKGTAKIKAKVVYRKNGKKKTKTFTVKVTVKNKKTKTTKKTTSTPTPTLAPEKTNIGKEHTSANGITTKDNGLMRSDLKSTDLMKYMGQGINIGNTLEGTLDASVITEETTVSDYEKAWGNPLITQELLDGMKEQGFNTVRVPIAWSNMISDDGKYTISEQYLNRVEEVINYALNNEMYVIINIHWDGDWWGQFGDSDEAVRKQAWARYEAFWTQIANRYKEYSDRLVFESANEELGDRLNDDWEQKIAHGNAGGNFGTLNINECYETTNKINQKFVDIVRKSGGNNAKRQLLIAGYNTDIAMTCDSRYKMPTDIAGNGTNKMSVSVHYYNPATYCIVSKDEGWGFKDSWGTKEDKEDLHGWFDKMTKFTKSGYGVIIGEYGVAGVNKDGIPDFLGEVARYGAKCGFCPVLWDIGSLFDRTDYKMKFIDVAQVYKDVTGSKITIPATGDVTGIKESVFLEEEELELKYTWTGSWNKNDGSNQNISFTTKTIDEGFDIFCNEWKYYVYLTADWASMEKPCLKATLKLTTDTPLELAYIDYVNGIADDSGDQRSGETQIAPGWQGKCVVLDKEKLLANDALCVSFGGKVTCTKLQIYDLAE